MSRLAKHLSLLERRDPSRPASDLLLASEEKIRVGAVTRAGRLVKCEPGAEFRQGFRSLQAYSVILLLSGRGYFRDARGFQARVSAGDLIWVFPGLGHVYGPEDGDRWEEIYLVFSGSMFDCWLETGFIDPQHPIWSAEPVSRWHRRLAEVVPTRHPIGEFAALSAAGRLQSVIADLTIRQESHFDGPETPLPWLDDARRRLKAGEAPVSVARNLKLDYDYFRKRFVVATGLPPARFQMLRRIECACALLREGSLSLKAIAERSGFADEFHFSKRFRQIVGQPPGQFRKNEH